MKITYNPESLRPAAQPAIEMDRLHAIPSPLYPLIRKALGLPEDTLLMIDDRYVHLWRDGKHYQAGLIAVHQRLEAEHPEWFT